MSVFLSYQRADEAVARSTRDALSVAGIQTYLDVLDPGFNPEKVTASIVAGLRACTHLLAIVSPATVRSWWVPFEIGVATSDERRIATLTSGAVELPEYLKIWPILNRFQIQLFIQRYLQDVATPEAFAFKSYGTYQMREAVTKSIASAGTFHARLKQDLGQP